VYQLSTEVLGVYPLEPGFTRFRLSPQPADLTHARGVFPTVRGDIRVAWQQTVTGLDMEVVVPDGTRADVVAPPGYMFESETTHLQAGVHRLQVRRKGS
jgi:hypothetical protein